ncbi:MAG TPA: helix-turn-helix transcriptional regulator [Streptosporangiaceae bacterium]|nr:helix-turn-helix transcriptional regulator [Streptosporangiaceae bacterium]
MPALESNPPKGTPRAVFGAMLRHYRMRAGLTQDQVGSLAHVSGKLISAYENGWRVPTRPTTGDIDSVGELNTHGALTELWDQFEEGMNYQAFPDWFQDWPEKEAMAATLRGFEPLLVPGLLQTDEYARALFGTQIGTTEDEIDELVAARLKRQEVLTKPNPPTLWIILDEWVLRRPVGGRHVMLEQVTRLIEAAQQPNVVFEVIPAEAGAHDGLSCGGFAIADFKDAPSVAYQESAVQGQIVQDPEHVARLVAKWTTLGTEALPRKASVTLLEESAKSWTSHT